MTSLKVQLLALQLRQNAMYETTHRVALERQRLEEVYFLWRLLSVYKDSGTSFQIIQREESCRANIESLCAKADDLVCLQQEDFIDHVCQTNGCAQGFVMADGIEKVCFCNYHCGQKRIMFLFYATTFT